MQRTSDAVDHGDRIEDAIEAWCERVAHPDAHVVACAVVVSLRVGGDLSSILGDAAQRIEQRQHTAEKLGLMSRQARMTAWLVVAMPAAGAAAAEIAAPGLLTRTIAHTPGQLAMLGAAAMLAIAVVGVRRIAQVRT